MPSVTPKQKRTMAAAAHDPAFARKVGIPVAVAKEFNAADAARGDAGMAKANPFAKKAATKSAAAKKPMPMHNAKTMGKGKMPAKGMGMVAPPKKGGK